MSHLNDYGPIADLYDTYVPAAFDIPFFLNEVGKTRGEVLELMAGTGRVSLPLAKAGAKLTCVDSSPEMLALLRNKLASRGLAANLHATDICTLDLGKQFDLVIIPFHSFVHITSLDDQRAALARIRQHLAPGGHFICTFRNQTGPAPSLDGTLRLFSRHALPDGQGTLLFWLAQNNVAQDKQITNITELFEEYDARGLLVAKRLLELQVRQTSKAQFENLARSAGFDIIALYGDYEYGEFQEETSPFAIWVLA